MGARQTGTETAKRAVRQQIDVLTDDLDGRFVTYKPTRDVITTVPFGIDGEAYEIDLTDKHAEELRRLYAPYVEKGRRAHLNGHPRGRPVLVPGRLPGRTRQSRATTKQIRAWAQQTGHNVKPHGRIAAEIVDQYHAAHAS
jgi:hypothetical protein